MAAGGKATTEQARTRTPRPKAASAATSGRPAGEAGTAAPGRAADFRAGRGTPSPQEAAGRLSPVEQLLADRGPESTPAAATPAAAPLPPVQDVALGLAALVADALWRAGAAGVALVGAATTRVLTVARAITPAAAAELTDASLQSLAERGRRVRAQRTVDLTDMLTTAMANATGNPAVREIAVAAIGEATEEVLAVVLPSVLDAMSETETQDRLDELMAGLLVRQMPAALEKTLPGVMLRTATKPALGIVPSVMGALRPQS